MGHSGESVLRGSAHDTTHPSSRHGHGPAIPSTFGLHCEPSDHSWIQGLYNSPVSAATNIRSKQLQGPVSSISPSTSSLGFGGSRRRMQLDLSKLYKLHQWPPLRKWILCHH